MKESFCRFGRLVPVLLCAGVVVCATTVRASNVVPMNLEALSDHAGQVIVGKVVSVESYWAYGPRRIESEVTFAQVEYLKGALPDSGSTFKLTVPGGTVGQTGMRIGCAPEFAVDQKWLLFLLPTYKTFPVVGLSQGAFRIQVDGDGVERVLDASGSPVVGADAALTVQTAQPQHTAVAGRLRDGHNVRVESEGESVDAAAGEAYEDFLARLGPILERSRDHRLSEPAGRRVLVEYTPVPLVSSARDRDEGQADTTHRPHSIQRTEVQTRNPGRDARSIQATRGIR